jgi:hypothetical protein
MDAMDGANSRPAAVTSAETPGPTQRAMRWEDTPKYYRQAAQTEN